MVVGVVVVVVVVVVGSCSSSSSSSSIIIIIIIIIIITHFLCTYNNAKWYYRGNRDVLGVEHRGSCGDATDSTVVPRERFRYLL